jgi:hypothetical protein
METTYSYKNQLTTKKAAIEEVSPKILLSLTLSFSVVHKPGIHFTNNRSLRRKPVALFI